MSLLESGQPVRDGKPNQILTYLESFSKGLNGPETIKFQCPLVQVEENGQPVGRILILGNDYLFVFDQPKSGQDYRPNKGQRATLKVVEVHYFDVLAIDYTKKMFKLKVRAREQKEPIVYHFRTDDTPVIVAGLYNTRLRVGGYWPAIQLESIPFKFAITEKWMPKLKTEHFLKTYYAWSSYTFSKSNNVVPTFIRGLENKNNRELDLNSAPGFDGSQCKPKYLQPFICSLWHDHYFRSFMVRDMPDSGILHAVAGALENNKHLKKLVVNNLSNTTPKAIERFMTALDQSNNNSLEIIDLRDVKWGSIDGLIFCLERYTGRITYINLCRCGLNGTLMSRFFLALASNPNVTKSIVTLNLSYNEFDYDESFTTSNNARIWIEKYGDHMDMEKLGIAGTKCSLKIIFDGMKRLKKISNLDISKNRFRGVDDMQAVVNFVNLSTKLTDLKLGGMDYDVEASLYEAQLIEYLCKNTNVNLDISGCACYGSSLPKLIQTVTHNHLSRLDISNLGCSEQQFDAIVNSIITLKQLLKLNVSNIVSKTAPLAISRVVVSLVNLCLCSHVESIAMQGFGQECMMKLFYEWNKKAKEENVVGKVGSLDITFNQLGNLGLESFAFFLEENKSLRKVKIDNNNVTYNGWNAIYNALFFNFTLEKIVWPTVDLMKACQGKAILTPNTARNKKKKQYHLDAKPSYISQQEQVMQLMWGIEARLKKFDINLNGVVGFSYPVASHEIIPPVTGSRTPVFMNWDLSSKNNEISKKRIEMEQATVAETENHKKKIEVAPQPLIRNLVGGMTRGDSFGNLHYNNPSGTPRSWSGTSRKTAEDSDTASSDEAAKRREVLRKHSATSRSAATEKALANANGRASGGIMISRGASSRGATYLGTESPGERDSGDSSEGGHSSDPNDKVSRRGTTEGLADTGRTKVFTRGRDSKELQKTNSNPHLVYVPPAHEQMSSSYEKGSAEDASLGGQLKFMSNGNRGGMVPDEHGRHGSGGSASLYQPRNRPPSISYTSPLLDTGNGSGSGSNLMPNLNNIAIRETRTASVSGGSPFLRDKPANAGPAPLPEKPPPTGYTPVPNQPGLKPPLRPNIPNPVLYRPPTDMNYTPVSPNPDAAPTSPHAPMNPNPNANPHYNPNPNPNPHYNPNPNPHYNPNPNSTGYRQPLNNNPSAIADPNANSNPSYNPNPNAFNANPSLNPNPTSYNANPNPNPTYNPNPNLNPSYNPNNRMTPNPNPNMTSSTGVKPTFPGGSNPNVAPLRPQYQPNVNPTANPAGPLKPALAPTNPSFPPKTPTPTTQPQYGQPNNTGMPGQFGQSQNQGSPTHALNQGQPSNTVNQGQPNNTVNQAQPTGNLPQYGPNNQGQFGQGNQPNPGLPQQGTQPLQGNLANSQQGSNPSLQGSTQGQAMQHGARPTSPAPQQPGLGQGQGQYGGGQGQFGQSQPGTNGQGQFGQPSSQPLTVSQGPRNIPHPNPNLQGNLGANQGNQYGQPDQGNQFGGLNGSTQGPSRPTQPLGGLQGSHGQGTQPQQPQQQSQGTMGQYGQAPPSAMPAPSNGLENPFMTVSNLMIPNEQNFY